MFSYISRSLSDPAIGWGVLAILIIVGGVLSIGMGVFCAVTANKKGYRFAVVWFFFGLAMSLIALIVCIMLEDKTKKQPVPSFDQYVNPPLQNQPQPLQCRSCGMVNPPDAQCCMQCGEKLY